MGRKIITLQINITKKNLVVLACSILLIASLATAVSVGANPLRETASDKEAKAGSGEEATLTSLFPIINYQGRLLQDEQPVNGSQTMTFKLFDAQYGGVEYWKEENISVDVSDGLFTHPLGLYTPLPKGQFDRELWLEVTVGSIATLPRQRLMGAPYAFSLIPGAKVSGAETDASVLTVENSATGGVAVSAISAGNAPAIKATNNAGGPVIAGYGLGGDSKFEVSNNGDITYDGALDGAFPRPAYDSGWVSISQDQHLYLYHWLGGSADDYFVDLIFYDGGTHGINIHGHGAFRQYQEEKGSGAFWRILDNEKIVVKRKKQDEWADKVRVRIWVCK